MKYKNIVERNLDDAIQLAQSINRTVNIPSVGRQEIHRLSEKSLQILQKIQELITRERQD